MRFRNLLLFLVGLFLLSSLGSVYAQEGVHDKIGVDVRTSIATTNEAQVVIALEEPPLPKGEGTNRSVVNRKVQQVQTEVLSKVSATEFQAIQTYESVPALAGRITSEAALDRLAGHPKVRRIDLDVGGQGGLSSSVQTIRAHRWHDREVTGEGTGVAVLDSGIDPDHDDLADDLAHEACFLNFNGVGQCPNGSDRQTGSGAATDDHGHGTSVAGIITSDGKQAPQGVAPDAEITAIKVLNADNRFSAFSEIVAALDYVINHPELGVQVVNMSLGTDSEFQTECDNATAWNMSGASAVRRLRAQGVLTVASSMNEGSHSTLASPACLSEVVSVGATDTEDNVTDFTNSNQFLDLVAPGVGVQTSGVGNTTHAFGGTSAAAPHAAGCAALLQETEPDTSPDAIEASLKTSPVQVTDAKNELIFPRLDCYTVRQVTIAEMQAGSTSDVDAPTRPFSLRWQTTHERNSEGFVVERRAGPLTPDAKRREAGWTQIGVVESKASQGRSVDTLQYQYEGEVPTPGTYAFRLRHVTTDGPEKGLFVEATTHLTIPMDRPFTLEGPQPNPSRGTARVELVVEETQDVRIALYDALGRRLQVLHNEPLDAQRPLLLSTAGQHLASGTYFLQVEGEAFSATRKMVVVR